MTRFGGYKHGKIRLKRNKKTVSGFLCFKGTLQAAELFINPAKRG